MSRSLLNHLQWPRPVMGRKNPAADIWTKRAVSSGKFTRLRERGDAFKGVRREN